MVHRSALILAAVALGVAPALAAPAAWSSNELEARAEADELFARNQEDVPMFTRDVEDFDLFARSPPPKKTAAQIREDKHHRHPKGKGKEGTPTESKAASRGRAAEAKIARRDVQDHEHRKPGEHHENHHGKHKEEQRHDKKSVSARDVDESVQLFSREPHRRHSHHGHHRGAGPANDNPSATADTSAGGLSRRDVEDYSQMFTRDVEDFDLFARSQESQPTKKVDSKESNVTNEGKKKTENRTGGQRKTDKKTGEKSDSQIKKDVHHKRRRKAPLPATQKETAPKGKVIARGFDEDAQLFARSDKGGDQHYKYVYGEGKYRSVHAHHAKRALFTRDFDEELFARAPQDGPQGGAPGGFGGHDGFRQPHHRHMRPSGPPPDASSLSRRNVDSLYAREIDQLD